MPVDYSKGKIYKLTTIHNPDLVYYGSTVNPLYKRKGQHKLAFKNGQLSLTSSKLFELGFDNVEITLVENFSCNNKEELLKRERFYIENNNCVNKNIPCRTRKEYYEQNKNEINIKTKEYYEQNKTEINIKHKKYYEQNKNEINIKHKNREKNKEILKQYQKEYREKNKEILKQKRKEKYEKKNFII